MTDPGSGEMAPQGTLGVPGLERKHFPHPGLAPPEGGRSSGRSRITRRVKPVGRTLQGWNCSLGP